MKPTLYPAFFYLLQTDEGIKDVDLASLLNDILLLHSEKELIRLAKRAEKQKKEPVKIFLLLFRKSALAAGDVN